MPPSTASASGALPPGPPARTGVLDSLGFYLNFLRDPIGFVSSRFDTYGDLYYAPSGNVPLFVVKHPDHIREVLQTSASKYRKTHSAFRQLSRFIGDGLLTTDGEQWKRQRRMVQPAFSKTQMAGYADVMTDESQRVATVWRDGEVREVGREMMELTLRIVSRTLFGHDVANDTDDVASAMTTFQGTAARPDILPGWVPTPHRRKVRQAIAALDRIMYGMIERRRKQPQSSNGGRTDLLQMLVGAVDEEGDGGRMGEREVRDQLVTLFLAGHETTSHALTWTWYLLAKNPEVAARLHAELDSVLGGRAATADDLPRLEYTGQVIEEAMRLYPPAYLVGRMAHEDTEIGGYPVRAGSEVIVWIYMTHHDARWFPRPEAFEPERFSKENAAKIPKFAYVPFGAGPRACIGKAFAVLEAQIILATLAQRFTLEVHEGQRVAIHPRITLSPKHGMKMNIRAR